MMQDGVFVTQALWSLVILVIVIIPFWRICTKAGFSGWWSLLVVVPMVNLAFLYFLAFARWPSQRRFL